MQPPPAAHPETGCINCGAEAAPHLGELRTDRVADGVVRDKRVYRCTPCQLAHTAVPSEQ